MACNNSDYDVIHLLENKVKQLKHVVSENWMTVDKSKSNESSSSSNNRKLSKLCSKDVFPPLRPYVPFGVEELSCTTRLDTWSNCNVRVIGFSKVIDQKYYLESINEPGGTYKILVSFESMNTILPTNQTLQVFGRIKVFQDEFRNNVPFIEVLFFRDLKGSDVAMYTRVIEQMRRFIPLFVNVENTSTNYASEDRQYFNYHENYSDDDYITEINSCDDL